MVVVRAFCLVIASPSEAIPRVVNLFVPGIASCLAMTRSFDNSVNKNYNSDNLECTRIDVFIEFYPNVLILTPTPNLIRLSILFSWLFLLQHYQTPHMPALFHPV